MKCILLSAIYDGNRKKTVLKFYEPESASLILWTEKNNHEPYCYSTIQQSEEVSRVTGVIRTEKVLLRDVLKDSSRPMAKIVTNDPQAINEIRDKISTWESDIKYYQNYLYDNNLTVGTWYDVTANNIIPATNNTNNDILKTLKNIDNKIDNEKFLDQVKNWTQLLDQPIPKIRRVCFDIEVESEEGRLPDPKEADQRVTAIGFESEDFKKVFLLKRDEVPLGEPVDNSQLFETEQELLKAAFAVIESYPVVLTFNGDTFDMPYLYNRGKKLGIKNIPLLMMKKNATLKYGIHIDLYTLFKNRSLRIYTFANKYTDLKLDTIAEAIIGENKLEHGNLNNIPIYELGKYCYNDVRITYKLTSYNNDLVMNLLVILCRIGKMPMDDISRLGLNNWTRSMFQMYMRQNKILIPKREELDEKTVEVKVKSITDGKRYKGALVMEPKPGIHFDVKVMDFASLYPSIVKLFNLSFETVRCSHVECKSNTLPEVEHWSCRKKIGITPLLIGSLMELRVNYYKKLGNDSTLSQEEQEKYTTIAQTLKIILNGAYGMLGFEKFQFFYLPTAESITGVGRHIISNTIETAQKEGMVTLYGDTDSVFVKNPTDLQVNTMIKTTKEKYGVNLEVDKEYRYVVLSDRKKNYLGIKRDGQLDVKGLTGKKSHTPPFIKKLFTQVTGELQKVMKEEDFVGAKKIIISNIKEKYDALVGHTIPMTELAISIFLAKNPEEYKKNTPQHLKAANMLGKEIKAGEHIQFVKTNDKLGVKPIEIAKMQDINIGKYRDLMATTFSQIIEPLDIDFEATIGLGRKSTLDEFWG